VRARGRAQPRHRGDHDAGGDDRLACGLPRRRPLDRRGAGSARRDGDGPPARPVHRPARALAARDRHRHHAAQHGHRLLHLPRAPAQRVDPAADRAVPAARRHLARGPARDRPGPGPADRAHPLGARPRPGPGLAPLPHAFGPGAPRRGREPGRRRGARARRLRPAPGGGRRRQRAHGGRRRLPDPFRLQRLLLRHGQRPWLDLHRAGRLRLVAARQGAPGGDPVRRLRRLPGAPAAAGRRGDPLPAVPDAALSFEHPGAHPGLPPGRL